MELIPCFVKKKYFLLFSIILCKHFICFFVNSSDKILDRYYYLFVTKYALLRYFLTIYTNVGFIFFQLFSTSMQYKIDRNYNLAEKIIDI